MNVSSSHMVIILTHPHVSFLCPTWKRVSPGFGGGAYRNFFPSFRVLVLRRCANVGRMVYLTFIRMEHVSEYHHSNRNIIKPSYSW